jgi:hypothetical protein
MKQSFLFFFPQNRPRQCPQVCYVTSFMEYTAGDLLPKKTIYEKLRNAVLYTSYNTHSNYWRTIYGRCASQGIPTRRSNKRLCTTAFLKFCGALTPHYLIIVYISSYELQPGNKPRPLPSPPKFFTTLIILTKK